MKHLHLRFFHNVVGGPVVNVNINDKPAIQGLTYGKFKKLDFQSKKTVHITIFTEGMVLYKAKVELRDKFSTIIIVGKAGLPSSIEAILLPDSMHRAPERKSNLRLIHACYGAPEVDIIINNVKRFTLAYKQHSNYDMLDSNTPVVIGVVDPKTGTQVYNSYSITLGQSDCYEFITSGIYGSNDPEIGFQLRGLLCNKV